MTIQEQCPNGMIPYRRTQIKVTGTDNTAGQSTTKTCPLKPLLPQTQFWNGDTLKTTILFSTQDPNPKTHITIVAIKIHMVSDTSNL